MSPSPLQNNEGLFRISGLWGQAMQGDAILAEVTECSAAAEVQRIEVPIVGSNKQGYKPGRVSREGTFRVQKIDTRWELEVHAFVNADLTTRRNLRGTGDSILKPFSLIVGYDDPEALGEEQWRLDGCMLWRLPLGFSIGDDIRDLEFPFTYEAETPLETFVRTGGTNTLTGLPATRKVHGVDTPSGVA